MNQPTSKPDQSKVVLVYSALTIGFFLLLTLIWLIGSRGVEELKNVSVKANETAEDYQMRLSTALKIREEAINVIAQAKVMNATRDRRVPIYPFGRTFKEAKDNFNKSLEAGKRLWPPQPESRTVRPAELKAWQEVENAAPEFLAAIEKLAQAKKGEISDGEELSASKDNDNPVTGQNPFLGCQKTT